MKGMRRLALMGALAVAAGCAGSTAQVRVAVEMTGAGAGPGEQQRCLQTVREAGAVVEPQSGLHALVTVEPNGNRVQLLSSRRGLVLDKLEPQAPVEQLCKEAVVAARHVLEREPLPAPEVDEREGVVKSGSGYVGNPTSGAPNRGPISDH
jgi:hypothetical protein